MLLFEKSFFFSVLTFLVLVFANAEPEPRRRSKVNSIFEDQGGNDTKPTLNRKGKVFSLFNIVQFTNSGCRSTSTISGGSGGPSTRMGTCFRSDECTNKQGSAAGSCASGFGVCCVFFRSTGNVNQNCTYIRNPNFPSSYDLTTAVSLTIQKCSPDVCTIRLDFEAFTIQGTGNTVEVDTTMPLPQDGGGVCLDTFMVTTNTGGTLPIICGQNTGQHIYFDIGNTASDTAQLNFNFIGAGINRQWEIKATQIPCNTQGHPTGAGCLQYHTGLTGRLTTFNFIPTNDNHLANQDYAICIRQEAGFCCIEYSLCADEMSFSLDTNVKALIETACSMDYITIEGAGGTCSNGGVGGASVNKFCGDKFNVESMQELDIGSVCDCTAPFQVDIFTDKSVDIPGLTAMTPNLKQSRGICLDYRQIPC